MPGSSEKRRHSPALVRKSLASACAGTAAQWVVLVVVGWCVGCGTSGTPPAGPGDEPSTAVADVVDTTPFPWPAPVSSDYVGSLVCAECHAGVADEYRTHPMSRSLARVSSATAEKSEVVAEFATRDGVSYYVEQAPDGTWHHERRETPDGTVLYDQKQAIDVAVGSGQRGRSFLMNVDGRLFQSPISWYAEGDLWALSPGYAPEFHQRFERQVTHACLACHSGRANPHAVDANRFADPLFFEESIGCERCHGPGKDHVAYQRSAPAARGDGDPIVNPARLDTARQDAVCNQCHLQGKQRVLRYGRSEFDFRPGMSVSDVWITLVKTAGVRSGSAAAVSQVEQMHASACYRQSQGAMTCTSCHDPHRRPRADEADAYYRQRCLECHASGQSECSESLVQRQKVDDACTACHMPSFAAADVHAAQTDHRILKRPEAAASGDSANEPTNVDPVVFAEPGVAVPPGEVQRAKGIYLAERAYLGGEAWAAERSRELLTPVLPRVPRDVETRLALGKALLQSGQPKLAEQMWLDVLAIDPRHEDTLEVLATMYHQLEQPEQAKTYYERLVEVNPSRSRFYGRLAHVLGQVGEIAAGIAAAEEALRLDPSLIQAHFWLVEAYRRVGDSASAQRHIDQVNAFRAAAPTTGPSAR